MSEVTPGQRLPERVIGPVSKTDIIRYQGASGDFHPLHHDEEFARSAGFPGVFAVGMLHAGYLATYCVEQFGAQNVRRFQVRFREQVWPGDTLICSGAVSSVTARDNGDLLTLDLAVTRRTGGVAATAVVDVLRPRVEG